ncbi:AI-2E family transporter [Methanoregula sp.]|uniref:AI-2E family transporter n=1 Tax=Methanoregula sp. TaxID=2052170 RepID=UPI002D7FEDFE|nr:AI-2E family transporter [Methanoregula sp.]
MTLPALSPTERVLLCLALFVIIIFGIRMIGSVATILLVALVLALLLYPATVWLQRRGLSVLASVGAVTIAAALCIVLFVYLTVVSFNVIIADMPLYQSELALRLADLTGFLTLHGISTGDLFSTVPNLAASIPALLSSILNFGTDLMDVFFVAVTTFFMLLEAPPIIARAEAMLAGSPEKCRQLAKMSGFVVDFMVVRTETNFVHGVLFGGSLALMGVHAAILWGVLTFVLGYIPYFGLILAAIPALFFAWLQFGIWGVIAVVAIVCVLNLIVENPVFSFLAARKFEIPALVVILSVIFWGWLLGLAGMLFSVPFTLMTVTLFEFSDELSWINTLLGLDPLFAEKEAPG